MDKDANINGSRGIEDLKEAFLSTTNSTEYKEDSIKNMYIYPIYRLRLNTILNPINTNISPIPNGFLSTFPNISITADTISPTNIEFCGILSWNIKIIKKYITNTIKYTFTNTCGTPLYILSK